MSEEVEFDLVCIECGLPIRLSRTIDGRYGKVDFFADEEGLENVDFHFHVPN